MVVFFLIKFGEGKYVDVGEGGRDGRGSSFFLNDGCANVYTQLQMMQFWGEKREG